MLVLYYFTFLFSSVVIFSNARLEPSCFSDVYCYGSLLHTVQIARIFPDSKHFVDMKMINGRADTLQNFQQFMKSTNHTPTVTEVSHFVHQNFEDGNELENWTPSDFNSDPKFLTKISNNGIRNFAKAIVGIWPHLGREVKTDVFVNPQQYSLIPVPHGFIIPGGRFREYYYWDSYWIVKGLLISEMGETARGMIDNFIYLVKTYGFIPNGGRIYYLNRSQPPLLTKMVYTYFEYSKDMEWLRENIQYLEMELNFWLTKRVTKVKKGNRKYLMAHYDVESSGPRPESYYEDFTTAEYYTNVLKKEELYGNLKSGAESGWDFSSRWIFNEKGDNRGNMTKLHTKRVIPVDLNSFICEAFYLMSDLHANLSNNNKSVYWRQLGNYWRKSIDEVLWDDVDGIWYDFDMELSKPRKFFYPSNVAPLWSNCINPRSKEYLGKRVLNYLLTNKVFDTPGGIATSLEQTGEQWDFPNAWAPLQAMMGQALRNSGNPTAVAKGKDIAINWIKSNLLGFEKNGELFEKYDALIPGEHGGGGEYVVQAGFGWTNGVALEFISDYFTNTVL